MIYSLPYTVEIDGKEYRIRNNCDYRVVLDVIEALNDPELTDEERGKCALFIFYGDELNNITNIDEAVKQMIYIINGGENDNEPQTEKPKLMDWQQDFKYLAPPISRVLGYDVRTPDRFTHWYTWLGGYMEVGECTFSTIVSIRSKKAKGKKLDKWEQEYYREHKKIIDFPTVLTAEEEEYLNADW